MMKLTKYRPEGGPHTFFYRDALQHLIAQLHPELDYFSLPGGRPWG